jgi:phosphopantothenoylcysteine decarboxylase/phosphopantothenate--cysteine ligase
MDEDMWLHPATKANLERVRSFGNRIIPVAHGELASGLVGEGRMAEPEELRDFLLRFFSLQQAQPLKGQRALVTAGPTYERIDPVRFVGNFSTGKMGIALAETLARQGAEVTLVLGPTQLRAQHHAIQTINVESAEEMLETATSVFPQASIAIMAAAVADYKPSVTATDKIKKSSDALSLQLTKTSDILKALGAQKRDDQFLVGFALETSNEEANALQKLQSKGADMIVLNSLRDAGAGFGHDTNKVTMLYSDGSSVALPLQSKEAVAEAIVKAILEAKHETSAV